MELALSITLAKAFLASILATTNLATTQSPPTGETGVVIDTAAFARHHLSGKLGDCHRAGGVGQNDTDERAGHNGCRDEQHDAEQFR